MQTDLKQCLISTCQLFMPFICISGISIARNKLNAKNILKSIDEDIMIAMTAAFCIS